MSLETSNAEATALVIGLYDAVLKRTPSDKELGEWVDAAKRFPASVIVQKIAKSREYAEKNKVKPFFANGHYHSPVVDPTTLGNYIECRAQSDSSGFGGIEIDVDEMRNFWDRNKEIIAHAGFPEAKTQASRFYFEGAPFPYGDALTLHAMIGQFRPKRIVEIGSGFSTACMLDSADIHGLDELEILCIEPYPDRLNKLLRPSDTQRVRLLEKPIQEIPVLDIVGKLEPGDILFIDSTHVLKTGSDVHYELFEIIPAIKPGVIVHIHDCPYPFEYRKQWIEKNYSWNEVYAVRAFLMYNTKFKILFWGSMFKSVMPEKVVREGGRFSKNAGTSLWLSCLA